MSVYSTRFFAGHLPTAFTELYVVPATMTVVLRDMEFYNGTGAPTLFNVQGGVSGSQTILYANATLEAGTWSQWQGRAVVNAGEGIWGFCGVSGVSAYISGYLLSP